MELFQMGMSCKVKYQILKISYQNRSDFKIEFTCSLLLILMWLLENLKFYVWLLFLAHVTALLLMLRDQDNKLDQDLGNG